MSEKWSEGELLQFFAGPFAGGVVEVVATTKDVTIVRITMGVYIRLSNADEVLARFNV